jgi:UDP-N-acetylglucosamine transferase subunit ALG13
MKAPTSLLFVSVGTDHHPFHRLVGWMDDWLERRSGRPVTCVVQGGTSRPSRLAEFHDYLRYQEMQAAMQDAAAVVCHGGPGTIMEARVLAHVPIVVPRQSRLGEHVDDHQVAFARRLASAGEIHLPWTESDLHELLDLALIEPSAFRSSPATGGGSATAIRRFGELVDSLVDSPERAGRRRRRHGSSARSSTDGR